MTNLTGNSQVVLGCGVRRKTSRPGFTLPGTSFCGNGKGREGRVSEVLQLFDMQTLKSGFSYRSRDYFLGQLGFLSYRDYLGSELWRSIRNRVFKIKGRICALCGQEAQAVHHNRYHRNDLTGENLAFVNPICNPCHKKIEFKEGSKRDLCGAKSVFWKILKKRERNRARRASKKQHREKMRMRRVTTRRATT